MSTSERRKHSRVKTNYPISYVCMDKKGRIVQQNMGVALNISQSGILIETADSVFSKYITISYVDLNKDIIEIKGKVAYCKMSKTKKYRVGKIGMESNRSSYWYNIQLFKIFCKKNSMGNTCIDA